ncbi:contractile injection system tape measure protein [Desulfoluna spongiiphila]|uniref:Uncharacterized protein n=1 Tax=Desulfoluna spongiiphila TaxID=419481 RepID=A0A1G5DJD2_9BACT|nr:contractile injection system tape measure protein [Desulfoluna spongiiphila]SCY14510.1 hypothetical protein SAMN05216233_104211 [Desulfoluna spongiiphila]
MTRSFLVRRARFEVALTFGPEGQAVETALVALLRERVLPVLESVLEGFDWPSGDLLIPALVMDLGEVTATEAAELIPRRFETQLTRMLIDHVRKLRPLPPEAFAYGADAVIRKMKASRPRTGGDGREAVFRRVLKKVLVFGRGGRNMSRVAELWPEFPWVVRHMFFFYAHDRNVPRHGAHYLGRALLKQSAMLLCPEHGGFVGGFVAKTAENRILLKHTAPVSGDADGFERLLWEFTLGYLLVEGKGRFERKQYVSHLISRIASHENVDARRLLLAFQTIFLHVPGIAGQQMREIFGALVRETMVADEKRAGAPDDGADEVLGFPGVLERVLEGRGSVADVDEVMRRLIRGDADIREMVLREGRRADARSAMVKALSHDQLESLVASLGPDEAAAGRFVNHCISHGTVLQQRSPEVQGGEVFSRQLWELSLAFLLVERKSRFNFKRYLQHLISGMASRYNMAYATLLDAFRGVYATGGGKREQDDLALLDELWLEEHQRESRSGTDGKARGARRGEVLSPQGKEASSTVEASLAEEPGGVPSKALSGPDSPEVFSSEGGPSVEGKPGMVRLIRFLDAAEPPGPKEAALCVREIQRGLAANGALMKGVLAGRLTSRHVALRLAGALPVPDSVRVLHLLAPSWRTGVSSMLDAVLGVIDSAGTGSGLGAWKHRIRAWAFQLAASPSGRPMTPSLFLRSLLGWMGRNGSRGQAGELLDRLAVTVRPGASGTLLPVATAIHDVLYGKGAAGDRGASSAVSPPGVPGQEVLPDVPERGDLACDADEKDAHGASLPWDDDEPVEEICRVDSAGLVILSPYLPTLFSRLGYVENGRFKDRSHADRAVLLLHYISHKIVETPDSPMALNRLLCGIASEGLYLGHMTLVEEETNLAEEMLRAVTAHWTALKNTTPDGLRESFLARSGDLILKDGAWHLTVEPRGWDVLLDRLPWGLTPIKHPWMKQVLYVNWR